MRYMKNFITFSLALSIAACVPQSKPWTADQKAKIGNIQLAGVTAEADAYQAPSGVSSQSGPMAVPVGVDPIAAAVGVTIGALVVKGIEANADAQFRDNFSSSLQVVNRTAPTNIVSAVTPSWQKELRALPFVRKRLGSGGSTLALHISDYGLVNTSPGNSVYADKSNAKYVVMVNGRLTVKNPSGKTIYDTPVSGYSQGFSYTGIGNNRASTRHITHGAGSTLQEWAARPDRLRAHVKMAATDIARDCAKVISEKAGE